MLVNFEVDVILEIPRIRYLRDFISQRHERYGIEMQNIQQDIPHRP